MIKDGLWDAFNGYHMGNTAENVAKQYQITRAAAGRVRRRLAEQGRGGAEGRQLQGRDRPGHDQDPQGRHRRRHRRISRATAPRIEAMAKLRPAFEKDGTVTAGNASGINDGAAARGADDAPSEAAKRGMTPLARIVSWAPGRRRSDDHGHRADPGVARGAEEGRLDDRRSRPDRGQRGLRGAGLRGQQGPRLGYRARSTSTAARSRIGHPIGASGARVLMTLLLRDAEARRQEGPRHAVHRRRHGHRDVRRSAIDDASDAMKILSSQSHCTAHT